MITFLLQLNASELTGHAALDTAVAAARQEVQQHTSNPETLEEAVRVVGEVVRHEQAMGHDILAAKAADLGVVAGKAAEAAAVMDHALPIDCKLAVEKGAVEGLADETEGAIESRGGSTTAAAIATKQDNP